MTCARSVFLQSRPALTFCENFLSTKFKVFFLGTKVERTQLSQTHSLLFSFFLSRSGSFIWMKDLMEQKINICQINLVSVQLSHFRSISLGPSASREVDGREKNLFSVTAPSICFSDRCGRNQNTNRT